EQAVLDQGRLYIAGCVAWVGNGPRASACVFTHGQTGWKYSTIVAKAEAIGIGQLRRSSDGAFTVRIKSRDYPRNLNACHATAHLSFEEEWRLGAGLASIAWRNERSTAYNTLDKIFPAIANHNVPAIRAACATPVVARRLLRARRIDKEYGLGSVT